MTTTLPELFHLKEFELVNTEMLKKKGYKNSGILEIVQVESVKNEIPAAVKKQLTQLTPNDLINITFRGKNLMSMDIGGKSDPFLVLKKATRNGPQEIYQTEVIDNNLNPQWKTLTLTVDTLTSGFNLNSTR
eukprot:TRINITY_DN2625_c0_g1_i12.p1 TRINITY_DN2625_c0_g1~~TRINITY_DN2625_c0_g1_i12.p1  ORF type:complete len:132 (-),score=60.96 TRINITY_DN2625_c0_g1_i12:24-419(-)